MRARLVAVVDATLKVVAWHLLESGWLDRLVGMALKKELNEIELPPSFQRHVAFLLLRGWVWARLIHTRDASRILAACDELRPDFVYFAALTYPDIASEGLALSTVFPNGGVLVALASDGMGTSLCAEVFKKVLDVRNNLYLLALALRRLPYQFAVFRGTFWAAPIFLAACRAPFMYRPSGFINQWYRSSPDAYWGNDPRALIVMERAILRQTILVMHNYTKEAIQELCGVLGLREIEHIAVYPGVHPRLVRGHTRSNYAAGGEVTVAYCGGYASPTDKNSAHANYLPYWRLLADARIHLHVYYSHIYRMDPRLSPVRAALEGHPYFHLHDPVPFLDLFGLLQRCDFLWAYFAGPMVATRAPFRRFIGAATCVGLCAGVPVIVNEYNEPLYSYVRQRGNGLAVPSGQGARLAEMLKQADREKMRRAALEVQDEFYFPEEKVVSRLRALGVSHPVVS